MAKKGSNIYRRADGRWEGRYYYRGTHKYRSVYGKTYTEAKAKLDRLRLEVLTPSVRCSLLFSDVMKLWLESRRAHIKESSYAGYRSKLEKQIFPYFEGLKYSRVEAEHVEAFIADKLSEGLSAKYVSDMVMMIRSAAKWAEINRNYADRVRHTQLPKTKAKETVVFSRDQQQRLISAIDRTKSPTACGVLLTVFTGLRIGELCALKWSDIDFVSGVLHINKSLQRIPVFGKENKTEVRLTDPKSATSVRDIPLPGFLLEMLSVYRGGSDDYIVSGNGRCIEPRSFTNRYKALLKKADVPSLKFHSLRHTFATNALYQDFDVKTLSEILGHANANITMRVYVHSSMERKKACMNRMCGLL